MTRKITKTQHSNIKAILLTLMAFGFFVICDVLRKQLAQDYSVIEVLFWTGLCSLALILLISQKLGGIKRTLQTKQPKLHLFRSFLMIANSGLALYAYTHLPLFDFYTLIFIAPFVTMALARIIWKEQITLSGFLAALIGFSGIVFAFRPEFAAMNSGVLATLAATITFSLINLTMKSMGKQETRLSYLFYPMTIMSLISFIVLKGDITFPSALPALFIILTAIFYVSGWLALKHAYSTAPAFILAPFQYSQLVWGMAAGYFIFAETPDMFKILGAALVVCAGLSLFHQESKKHN